MRARNLRRQVINNKVSNFGKVKVWKISPSQGFDWGFIFAAI